VLGDPRRLSQALLVLLCIELELMGLKRSEPVVA